MLGSEVRIRSSTRMPPRGPSASPASRASLALGRTPVARMTRSQAISPAFSVTTPAHPQADGAGSDDDRRSHLARLEEGLDALGVVQVGHGPHALERSPLHR